MALKEFYGETCPHCIAMKPLVEKLVAELGVQVEQYEVWSNSENAKQAQELDGGVCGGVPFFINTETGKTICGATDYESLKAWAQGA